MVAPTGLGKYDGNATILDPTQLRAVQYHRSAHIIYANKASVRLYLCVSVYVTSAV